MENLELLVWTVIKKEDGNGLSSFFTMLGGVHDKAYDWRGYIVPFHEAVQRSDAMCWHSRQDNL